MTFQQLMSQFTTGEPVDMDGPDATPWWEPGNIYEIDEATFDEKLDFLPPRWMGGQSFAFGEGAGPFQFFWKQGERCFVRELTADETEQFCQLARVPLHQ